MSGFTRAIRDDAVENAFASDEFLEFAASSQGRGGKKGVLSIQSDSKLPYLVTRRQPVGFSQATDFMITPICLSGPARFHPETGLSELAETSGIVSLAGGFIQTRAPRGPDEGLYESKSIDYYVDYRGNYRIPLGLPEREFLARMKRDSRGRVRKLLRCRDEFRIVHADGRPDESTLIFGKLYDSTAKRSGFPETYRFSADQWIRLLQNPGWNLYLLEYNGEPIAGAVVASVEGGFDYTFMGYIDGFPDASRAMIVFLYGYLGSRYPGYLDLGGGITENDALARFKLGMGAERKDFLRVRFAINETCARLCMSDYRGMLSGKWP